MKKTCCLIAIGLALCMAAPAGARSVNAGAGRSNVFADEQSYFLGGEDREYVTSSIDYNTCSTQPHYWEIPLPIDSASTKNIIIYARINADSDVYPYWVKCTAAGASMDGSNWATSLAVTISSSSKLKRQTQKVSTSVYSNGTLYLNCQMCGSVTLMGVSYNQ